MKITLSGGKHDDDDSKRLLQVLEYIHEELETANTWLALIFRELEPKQITDFTLHQLSNEGAPSMINGTIVGQTSEFQIGLVPPTGAVPMQSGPVVTVDDASVVLGPVGTDAAGNMLTFTAAVPVGDTGASYNVTISGVNGAGSPITHVFNVPILPQPAVQVTDFSLNQLS